MGDYRLDFEGEKAIIEGHCRWPYCVKHKKELREINRRNFDNMYEIVEVEIV
jgi:hypothetical protein